LQLRPHADFVIGEIERAVAAPATTDPLTRGGASMHIDINRH
jgi:hypothetical protein